MVMKKAWLIIKSTFWLMMIVAFGFLIVSSLNLFGSKTYVVKSGSMEPKIHTGSIVVSKNSNNYQKDDVITFKVVGSKDTVTHRIVEIVNQNSQPMYRTKGDANKSADPEFVSKQNVVGKLVFSIPLVGYLMAFVKTLPGLVIFVFIPAVIIISEEIANIKTEAHLIKQKRLIKKEKPKEPPKPDNIASVTQQTTVTNKEAVPKRPSRPAKPKRRLIQ